MTELLPFDYEGHAVRTVVVDGEPWFVAADVAQILRYRMASDMTRRLDTDDRGTRSVRTPSGDQDMTIINEPGLYEAVLGAKSSEARDFKRWVTHTVLPEIRRTGSFNAQPTLPSTRELAQMVIDAEDAREVAERQLAIEAKAREAMESYAKDLEPRAEGYDHWISGDGTYSIGNVAKMLGTSQNKLFDELRNAGVLIAKGAMRNTPYQRYMHHFAVKASEYERSDGTRGTGYTTRVQPSGVAFVARKVGRTVRAEVNA